jgi:hypothetical protein
VRESVCGRAEEDRAVRVARLIVGPGEE